MKSNADLLTEIGWIRQRTQKLDHVLKRLVDLKIYRDQFGADQKYITEKEQLWKEAYDLVYLKGEKNG